MNWRRRPATALLTAGLVAAGVVVASASPAPAGTAPGSMASTIASAPVRPPSCTNTQIANLDIGNCALYANGNPDDHGFATPPFPTEEIVTTPIPPEQWIPLSVGSSGPIVTLVQRALRAYNANLRDDGTFGNGTASVVVTAQTALGLAPTGVVDAPLAERLGVLVSATSQWPGPGWVFNGNTYSGSPILGPWEARLIQGAVRSDPDISAVFEGFVADLQRGSLRIDEKSAYGFRCVATSTRDCHGETPEQLSYHAWGAAIDINWTQNPLQTVTHPSDACAAHGAVSMPEWVIKLAQHWGLYWGGWYSCPKSNAKSAVKDPHHFEFRGTPDLARRIAAKNLADGAPKPPLPGLADLLLSCGDRGAAVAALRGLLPEADRPNEAESLQQTFTPALATALAGVQSRLGLPPTGAFDPPTAAALGVSVAHAEVFPVLHVNSCGEPVKALQRALGVADTGLFTSTTMGQLRTWQRSVGLAPTGIVDTATAAALSLRLEGVVPGPPPSTSAPSTKPPVDVTGSKVTVPLKLGNRSSAVKTLQRALNFAGYRTPATGYFGSSTAASLKQFMTDRGLPVSKVLTVAAAQALGLVAVPKIPTRYGERGEHVAMLQEKLRAAGYDVQVDGRFGKATRTALRDVQAKAKLRKTGSLDAKTAAALGF